MSLLTNIPYSAKSMNGIIVLDDGSGSTIENGTITTDSINVSNLITDDIILTRNSTPAVNTLLGSTIDVGAILNNIQFDPANKFITIYDNAANGFIDFDLSGNGIAMAPNTLSIYPTTTLDFSCSNTIFTNSGVSFQNSTLTIPRTSTPALNTLLGSTINVGSLIQNLNFNTTARQFEIWNDIATGQIFQVDVSNNNINISTVNMNIVTNTALNFVSPNLTLTNSTVSFPNSNVSFNSFLPTTTITSGFATNNFITKGYGDSTYQIAGTGPTLSGANAWTGNTNTFNSFLPTSTIATTSGGTQFITRNIADGRFGQLAAANIWTLQNTFRNGILPCSGTRTTDIQMGGNNQFQYRQATSANNISIGALAIQGDSVVAGQVNNTGKRNIGIGESALERLDAGNDNIFLGYQAGKNCGSTRIYGAGIQPQRCIAIGTFSQLGNLYMADSISIGYNSLRNASGPAAGNIMMGSNVGNGLTFQGNCTFIGTSCAPTVNDNAVTAVGYQALGAATGQFNSGTAIGWQAGYNNANGQGGTFIGSEAGYSNTTGNLNTCIGLKAGRNNASGALNLTCCIGYNSAAQQDNECVFGGELLSEQVFLTLPNKVRLACNQSPTGVAIGLSFRTNENVIISDPTTTSITLPSPIGNQNIGTKFHINRVVATSNITINAPASETIGLYQPNGAYITNASFTWTYASGSINLLCIGATAGGTNWLLLPPSISEGTNSLLSSTTIPSPSLNYSIPFGGQTTTGYHPYYMDNTNINYQPSTQKLTTTNQTITGSVVYKKYYLSMVNPTVLTGTSPLTMAPPLYEYVQVNLASGVIQLPLSSDVEIGTVIRFRRITTMTGGINLEVQTGSGQAILGRNSITTVSIANFLAASVTYGSVVFLSSNLWAILD